MSACCTGWLRSALSTSSLNCPTAPAPAVCSRWGCGFNPSAVQPFPGVSRATLQAASKTQCSPPPSKAYYLAGGPAGLLRGFFIKRPDTVILRPFAGSHQSKRAWCIALCGAGSQAREHPGARKGRAPVVMQLCTTARLWMPTAAAAARMSSSLFCVCRPTQSTLLTCSSMCGISGCATYSQIK